MYNRSMTSPWAPPGVNPESAPLRLATAGPIVHTPWVRQRSRADIEAELARETPAVTRAKPPIAVVGAVRLLWIVASVAAIVGLIVDLRQALVAAAIAYGSLVIWSGLAAVNVRRARPATVYAGPPAAASMMSAWLVPVAGAAIAMDIARGAEPFTAVWFGDAAVFGVLVLLGSLVPVALLARLASWAGDRPGEWWQWLIAPVLSLGLSMMLTVLFNVPLSDLLESESTTAASAGVLGAFAVLMLPAFVFVAVGWRAMRRLEAAARMTWERRAYPEGSLVIDSELTARLAESAYLAARPNG